MARKKKSYKLHIAFAVIGVLGVFGVGSALLAFSGGPPKYLVEGDLIVNEAPEQNLGVFSGTDVYDPIAFHGGFGGRTYVTGTLGTAVTLNSKELADFDVIEMMSYNSNLTITFPASSSLPAFLQNGGDFKTWKIKNASSTSASGVGQATDSPTITVAEGTGWHFLGSGAALTFAASSTLVMDCWRLQTASTTAPSMGDFACELREIAPAN